ISTSGCQGICSVWNRAVLAGVVVDLLIKRIPRENIADVVGLSPLAEVPGQTSGEPGPFDLSSLGVGRVEVTVGVLDHGLSALLLGRRCFLSAAACERKSESHGHR